MRIIRRCHQWELDYFDSVSPSERSALGTYENWAPKDRISHITYWRRRCIEKLSYLYRGRNSPEYPSPEECNRQNFTENRDKPVQALLHEANLVLEALPLAVGRFRDEELQKMDVHPGLRGNSILGYILDQCYSHPVYHLCEGYLHLGNALRVNQLQDQRIIDITNLDDSTYSVGTAYYDRACFSALLGETDAALSHLQKSLAGRPDLKPWAIQDAELASIREDPRFQELVASSADDPA